MRFFVKYILGLGTIALIVLKLFGLIDWSWWWVLVMVWGPILISLLLILFGVVVHLIEKRKKNGNDEGKDTRGIVE